MDSTGGRGRWARRTISATVLAATLGLTGLPAMAAETGTGTAALVDWRYGGSAQHQPWGYGGGQTSSRTSAVDSEPATAAESTGVVLIDTQLAYAGAAGAGTGIVLTSGGEVLTNYHVVEGATRITVTLASTGATYDATVVGHSETSDVALLQLDDASGLPTATVDDDTVSLGDQVTAVGNAGGTGTLTAADGSVTDLSSSITTASEGSVASEDLRGLIETDADVVPGDSGGPLLDAEGEVVGIDTAASSGSSSSTIDGYAIPIEDALAVVRQVRAGEESAGVEIGASAFLGVQVSDSGALAGVVDGSPAADAGLAAGDTVTAVGSTQVGPASALSAALAEHAVGDRVRIAWTDSAGESHHATVTLAASPTA